jgi:23S rRNA (cytosine1962-C5)-methyltransferase
MFLVYRSRAGDADCQATAMSKEHRTHRIPQEEPRLVVTGTRVRTPRVRPMWIYDNMVDHVSGHVQNGSTVFVHDSKGKFLGSAVYNEHSKIRARLFSLERVLFDADYVAAAVAGAVSRRRMFFEEHDSFRAVYSDADFLPGVIADKLGDVVVVELLTLAADLRDRAILGALRRELTPGGVVVRRDDRIREKEGLALRDVEVEGHVPPRVRVEQDGVVLYADPRGGQKTGLFLDQRFNRRLIIPWCAGRRVLDLFCHVGAWALTAARAGAAEAVGADSSADALELARFAARENSFDQVRFEQADVFDYLSGAARRGEQYDVVVCDPPAFAKSRKHSAEALRGYLSLNYRAMKLLPPGGVLATCSCSHHVTGIEFDQMLELAARNARMQFHVVASEAQPPDHPLLLGFPEGEYLKCRVLRRVA